MKCIHGKDINARCHDCENADAGNRGDARIQSGGKPKPYTLMRGIRERELFKRLVRNQQETIEICEELHQISDPPMQVALQSIISMNRDWQKNCIRFQADADKMLDKLSTGMGDLRK